MRACVGVGGECGVFGVLRRLWASLIKECAGADLLFLRSNFKVRVMEGLFWAGKRVGFSTDINSPDDGQNSST